jgi:hypothetical protein
VILPPLVFPGITLKVNNNPTVAAVCKEVVVRVTRLGDLLLIGLLLDAHWDFLKKMKKPKIFLHFYLSKKFQNMVCS